MSDTFEVESRSFRLEIKDDCDCGFPWDNMTTLAEVTEWTRRAKAPGESIVCQDRQSFRYYDFQAACAELRKQGVARKQAAESARVEYDYFRRWCADQWHYVGVVVTLLDEKGEETDHTESLWEIESDSYDYIEETARELAGQILASDNAAHEEPDFCGLLGIPTVETCRCAVRAMGLWSWQSFPFSTRPARVSASTKANALRLPWRTAIPLTKRATHLVT
jgi:hypothetical protein